MIPIDTSLPSTILPASIVTTSFAGPGLIQYDAVSSWQEGRTAVQMEVPVQCPRSAWRGSVAARKRRAVSARADFIDRNCRRQGRNAAFRHGTLASRRLARLRLAAEWAACTGSVKTWVHMMQRLAREEVRNAAHTCHHSAH